MQLMMAIMELSRGHNESAVKSKRNGAAWVEKRRQARAGGKPMTRRLPAWVAERDGKLVLVPTKAAAVRRIFELAAAGYGQGLIVKPLAEEKVPAIGDSGKWLRAYVARLLRDRRAAGDFIPCHRNGKLTDRSEVPIPGYYPAAVSEELWGLARKAS